MSKLKSGQKIGGFDILTGKYFPEYEATITTARHRVCGLEVAHIANDDPENLFAFIFRTPVDNDTGVPHILEHSTLCGSRRFPLKDPFMVLLKGSMQTFLNAFTGQDSTVYLASSTVEEDYFNLMLVYGDAVFFPLLKQEVFLQEGFHYEEVPGGGLKIQGVVYNEMKGNYSSPDSILYDWSIRSLFPDNTYGRDSGGDPRHIPELRYSDFLDFHRRYYHPANCRVFFYGNIPMQKQLEFLEKNFLGQFGSLKPDSSIPDQTLWQQPGILKVPFPGGEGVAASGGSSITLNWITATFDDPFELLKMELLSEILLGNAGSPLRKDLVESHLGEDLSPASGLDTGLKQAVFTAGLRGSAPQHLDAVSDCILESLGRISEKGVEPKIIDAALHRIMFRKRELSAGSPYGIKLLFRMLPGWVHDYAPWHTLGFSESLKKLKKYVKRNRDFYKELIRKYLLRNPHRSTILVYPDPALEAARSAELKAHLDSLAAEPAALDEIRNQEKKLKAFQAYTESAAELACVPCLTLSSLPAQVTSEPYREIPLEGNGVLLYHDILTHNIVYIDVAFPLGHLEDEWLEYLPLLGKLILGCGLPGMDYPEVSHLISLYTGSLSATISADTAINGEQKLFLVFNLKFLRENFKPAMDLFCRLLKQADFSNHQRIRTLILELRNKYKASLIPSANYYTSLRAASHLSELLGIEERWHGISQFQFLEQLSSTLDERFDSCLEIIESLRRRIFVRDNIFVNVSCQNADFKRIRARISRLFTDSFPPGNTEPAVSRFERYSASGSPLESILTSSSVNFVAHAFPCARMGTEGSAIEAVLSHLLTTGFLWDRVRLQGGAYGVSASSFNQQGVYTFSSFRDPQLNATLEAYKESLRRLRDGELTQEELKLAIIGTVGKHEKPLRGARRGYIQFKRYLCGVTDNIRQNQRDTILSLSCDKVCQRAAVLLESYGKGRTVLLAGRHALNEAGKSNSDLPGVITELPV